MTEVLNVRAGAALKAELAVHAAADGLKPSAWAREALLVVLASGLSLPELVERLGKPSAPAVVARNRASGLGAQVILSGRCLCPMHLRVPFGTFDRCSNCKQEYPR